MKRYIGIACAIFLFCIPTASSGQLVGGNYEIYADAFSFMSGNEVTGGIYTLYQTGGEFFASSSADGDYVLRGGFRAVEKGVLRVDMSTSSIDYGMLTVGVVASSSIAISVWTDSATGYTLFLREDQDPTSAINDTIADVTGGTVDGSTEAYGVRIFGDDTIAPMQDIPITTSSTPIATSSGTVDERTTGIVYKVAIDEHTPAGVYSHTLIHTVLVQP